MKLYVFLSTIISCISFAVFLSSCTKKKDVIIMDCGVTSAGFAADVNPIIQSTCAINSACHGVGSVSGPGPLTNYIQISGVAARIREAVISRRMPLGSTLSEANINKIKCWVASGAPNN